MYGDMSLHCNDICRIIKLVVDKCFLYMKTILFSTLIQTIIPMI